MEAKPAPPTAEEQHSDDDYIKESDSEGSDLEIPTGKKGGQAEAIHAELRKTNPFEEASFVDEMVNELHGVASDIKDSNEVWFRDCVTKLQGLLFDSPTLEATFALAIKENHVALMQVILKAKTPLRFSEANAVDNPVGTVHSDGFTVEMKAPQCPFPLEAGKTAKVLIRLQATKVFADCPRLKVATNESAVVLKLPITFLRFSKGVTPDSPQALIDSLSAFESAAEFVGLNPNFKSLAGLAEALSFEGSFQVLTMSKLQSLGRTGILLVADVIGKTVICKVTLRSDASGGTVSAMSLSTKLRNEVLRLVVGTVSP